MAEVVHVEHGKDVDAGRKVAGRYAEDLLPDDAVLAPENELHGAVGWSAQNDVPSRADTLINC